jgi:hypothetical protein
MPNSLKTTKPKTREEWLQRFTELSRPYFKKAGHPLPKKVRCSIGFPSKGMRGKAIGECWSATASEDSCAEIFIRPNQQSNASRIADILTHELCHAALPLGTGHGKEFKQLATGLGLTGKMTATTAGPAWHAWADPILKAIGPFPGKKLGEVELEGGKKKQTTRMLKLVCGECGWSCRTTATHINSELRCPCVDCDGDLYQPD